MTMPTKRSIPISIKLIAGIIVFMGMFVVAMVFGAAETSIKDVWFALTTSMEGEKLSLLREIRLPVRLRYSGRSRACGLRRHHAGHYPQSAGGSRPARPYQRGECGACLHAGFHAGRHGIMVACFIGAAIGAVMVFGIGAMRKGGFSPLQMVLAGSAVSAFLYAIAEGIGIYFKISKDVSMWTAGGVIGTSWGQLQTIFPFILIGIIIAIVLSRQLTILSLSEEVAVGLGQNILAIKGILFVVIVLLAGTSVALVEIWPSSA